MCRGDIAKPSSKQQEEKAHQRDLLRRETVSRVSDPAHIESS